MFGHTTEPFSLKSCFSTVVFEMKSGAVLRSGDRNAAANMLNNISKYAPRIRNISLEIAENLQLADDKKLFNVANGAAQLRRTLDEQGSHVIELKVVAGQATAEVRPNFVYTSVNSGVSPKTLVGYIKINRDFAEIGLHPSKPVTPPTPPANSRSRPQL